MAVNYMSIDETLVSGACIAGCLIGILVVMLITGILSRKLAKKKGYRGYFWTGFLLCTLGLIYVAGLPVKKKGRRHEMEDED